MWCLQSAGGPLAGGGPLPLCTAGRRLPAYRQGSHLQAWNSGLQTPGADRGADRETWRNPGQVVQGLYPDSLHFVLTRSTDEEMKPFYSGPDTPGSGMLNYWGIPTQNIHRVVGGGANRYLVGVLKRLIQLH